MDSIRDLVEKRNIDYSKPGLVLGSAPTVRRVRSMKFDGVRIGVGDMPWRAPEFGPYNYWVTANSYYPLPWIKSHSRDLKDSSSIVLLSSSSVTRLGDDLKVALDTLRDFKAECSVIYYDQRHFNGRKCAEIANCCRFSESLVQDVPIQELLNSLISKTGPAYSEGSTVALHGYALAVLLKCNPIYLIGIELPTTMAGYKTYKNWKLRDDGLIYKLWRLVCLIFPFLKKGASDFGGSTRNEILQDFQSIARIANSLGISTYSLSESSPLNNVEGIEYAENIF